jgi:hypothetical protein
VQRNQRPAEYAIISIIHSNKLVMVQHLPCIASQRHFHSCTTAPAKQSCTSVARISSFPSNTGLLVQPDLIMRSRSASRRYHVQVSEYQQCRFGDRLLSTMDTKPNEGQNDWSVPITPYLLKMYPRVKTLFCIWKAAQHIKNEAMNGGILSKDHT